MELNKENMRKIRKLILFTALLIVVLWKYEEVLEKLLGYPLRKHGKVKKSHLLGRANSR